MIAARHIATAVVFNFIANKHSSVHFTLNRLTQIDSIHPNASIVIVRCAAHRNLQSKMFEKHDADGEIIYWLNFGFGFRVDKCCLSLVDCCCCYFGMRFVWRQLKATGDSEIICIIQQQKIKILKQQFVGPCSLSSMPLYVCISQPFSGCGAAKKSIWHRSQNFKCDSNRRHNGMTWHAIGK